MALENQIAQLVEALTANTEALEAHTALLKGGITKKKPAIEAEPEGEAPKPKKAPKEQKVSKKDKKKAALSLDDVKAAFGEYLAVEDKEELTDRKANVGMILSAFKIKQVRDLSEDQFEEALDLLQEYIDQADDEDSSDGNDESLI